MKTFLTTAWLALALCLPSRAQNPDARVSVGRNSIEMKLRNGSTVAGNVLYVSPDGKIVEMQTARGNQPVWFGDVTDVRRDKEGKQWRKRPDAWNFRRRYDPTWDDPCRWEFGFYGDYGFGVGDNGLDRFEAGINVRYGVNEYLFVGIGGGINSTLDVSRITNSAFARDVNTTGCAVFATARGFLRNHGVRPFGDLRIGYNFPTGTYTDSESRRLSDRGFLLRLSAGIAVVDRSDIAYSLSVGYQMHSVKLTELNKDSFRRISGSVALQLGVTFRW